MKKFTLFLMILFLLAGCAGPASSTPSPTQPTSFPVTQVSPTPTARGEPAISQTNMPTKNPLPTATLVEPNPLPAPEIHTEPGPLYDTVLQIPVGEGGIHYRGAGVTDMEPVGPNGLVITPDGVIIVGDVYGNRLMRYEATGQRLADVDLGALDILNISDLVGIDDSLYILEISFKVLPERYRINQLSTEGALLRQYDLPKGFHFEDGLYGLATGYPAGGSPEVLIQLGNADDSRYYRLPNSAGALPEELPALPVFSNDLSLHSASPGELAVLKLGAQEFESQMTEGGTIFLLSARNDGSYYLERDDMVAWEPITTDITIHYFSPAGQQVGVARYPLMDWYFNIWRFLTIAPDGNAYGLITREQSVDVLRLNFYPSLEPIIPGAANPSIHSLTAAVNPISGVDCSSIKRISVDSAETEQIVSSFISNYKQDYPTEYMAFEQLWSVDKLEPYLVIQGMVTPEESDIIVAQETERGYVMLTRYIAGTPLMGMRHGDVAQYLAAQLPQAPAVLFYCLDLSHFMGGGD